MKDEATYPWGFSSDPDGDLWLHSDDPTSPDWTVTVVGEGYGQDEPREVAKRTESGVAFPALNWTVPLSAWYVGRDYCHVEIDDGHSHNLTIGTCPHKHVPTIWESILEDCQITSTEVGLKWSALPDGCLITQVESDRGVILAALTPQATNGWELSIRLWDGGGFIHDRYVETVETATDYLAADPGSAASVPKLA